MRALLLIGCLVLGWPGLCRAGASRSFDDVSTDIDMGNKLDVTTNDVSLCIWMKLTADASDDFAIGKTRSLAGVPGYDLACSGAEICRVDAVDALGNIATKGEAVEASGKWTFYCGTWNATTKTVTLYKNGVSEGTAVNAAVGSLTNIRAFKIGESALPGNNFNGLLAYGMAYLSRILTVVEVQELMQDPFSIAGASGLWACLGDSPEKDLSGNGVTGTVTGSTASTDGPPVFLTRPTAVWRRFWKALMARLVPSVYADDVILCDPADPTVPNRVRQYQRATDPFKSGLATDPNVLIFSLPANLAHPWDGVVPVGLAPRYWKCSGTTVIAMTASEQTALDAPDVAEQARQQAFTDEISGVTGDDLCNAELSVIDAKLDAGVATITDLATAKTFLRVALKKITRCLRARAR